VTGRTRCDLSRGIVVDDPARTITFHLTAADPDFVNKLALFSGVAVAPGTPVGKLRHPLPATGPYQVDHVGRVLRLVRNPRFRPLDGRPAGYADAITIDCCEDPKRAVEVIRRGRGDLLVADFGVPASLRRALDGLATRYPGQLHTTPVAATIYAFLNTRMPPFDRVDARRALSYAVDRAAFVALKGGERFGQPTCQFLPANFPGFRPYCPYTANAGAGRAWTGPDLVRARRLVARSGTRGMPVAVVASVSLFAEEARLLAAPLNRIGYRAHARILGKKVDYFPYIERRLNHVQIGLAGWSADYPSAGGYIRPIFGCIRGGPGAKERVNNPSGFCDARVEQMSRRAASPGHADAADALWAQIDRRITDQAPAVNLINPRAVAFLSSRAGNYIHSQQYGTLYDQLWVD
jgi:peptide/nickel transport system substrate-binding protein